MTHGGRHAPFRASALSGGRGGRLVGRGEDLTLVGMSSARHRPMLLLTAAALISAAVLLGLLAKLPELSSRDTVNLNSASGREVSDALAIQPALADRLLFDAGRRRDFAHADAAAAAKLLTAAEARRVAAVLSELDASPRPVQSSDIAALSGLDAAVVARVIDSLETASRDVSAAALEKITVVSPDVWRVNGDKLTVRSIAQFVVAVLASIAVLVLSCLIGFWMAGRLGIASGHIVFPALLVLIGMAVVTLMSIKDPLRDGLACWHHAWGAALGIVLMTAAAVPSYRRAGRFVYLYAAAALVLTVLLYLFGSGPGSTRLSLLGFQQIEIIKILLVLFVASYFAHHGRLAEHRDMRWHGIRLPLLHDIGPLLVTYGLAFLVLLSVRDLGPLLIVYGVALVVMYAATGRALYPVLGAGLLLGAAAFAYLIGMDVVQTRVDMWLSPWDNDRVGGDQLAAGYWAIASGGMWGSGLGLGSPSLVPRSGSDMVLVSIAEEWGLPGIVLVAVSFAALLQRLAYICKRGAGQDSFQYLLGVGFLALLSLTAVFIAAGTLGLLPLSGLALPFVCYGNSALLASFFVVGVLLSLERHSGNGEPVPDRRRRRVDRLGLLAMLLATVLVGRVAMVQVVGADETAARQVKSPDRDGELRVHTNPRLLRIASVLPRGRILDRNGRTLAETRSRASADGSNKRYYPYGSALAHLVGYADPLYGGPTGLEREYEEELRGFGSYASLVPALRTKDLPWGPRFSPSEVRTSVDAELQVRAQELLRAATHRLRDARTGQPKEKAAAVVLQVHAGEILVAASIPSFDPNELTPSRWAELVTDAEGRQPLFDRSRHGHYVPGSAFKIATAAAALEAGIEPEYECYHELRDLRWRVGGETYARKVVRDIEAARPHGRVDLHKALVHSCNVYFAQLGIDLGADRLLDFWSRLDISNLPTRRQVEAALPDVAMGQGPVLVTPMQMAGLAAAVANGGLLPSPHSVQSVTEGSGRGSSSAGVALVRLMQKDTAAALAAAMADVCREGTARRAFRNSTCAVAGKTGTAENEHQDGQPHAWFVGFTPADEPEIAVAVVVENGGLGGAVAAPIAREIIETWWKRRDSR